jgi:CDP-paratose 2-epimerase
MKYLVTGGLGVIGSRFIEVVLQDPKNEVIVIDSGKAPRNNWTLKSLTKQFDNRIEIINVRIEDCDLFPFIKECDLIFHSAAHTGIPNSAKDPNDDWRSNVDATHTILEVLRSENLKIPTVMLSSVKPYRVPTNYHATDSRIVWDDKDFPGINEEFVLEPDEPYAASKMAQSGLAMAYSRSYDLPVTVLRCSNLYGDAPCHGPRHGWLTWFSIASAIGWSVELQGSGLQTRDMLFSNDVASAVLKSFESINSLKGNVYNIGGGKENSISCRESIQLIEKILGHKIELTFGPGRQNEDMIFTTDYSKFQKVTGWTPKVSVQEGVEKIVNWAGSNAEDLRKIYGI